MGFAERLRAELVLDGFPGRVGFAAWDLEEREPVLVGAERMVHAASTIKVLIMIAALRAVQAGRVGLDTEVELPAERAGGFGVLRELPSVSRISLGDLIALMIVISDNAATNAVIDVVGFGAIRDCAADLGCKATRVQRRLMDLNAPGRNETTALDQARVLDALARGVALPPQLTEHALDVLSRQRVRDRLPALLPDGVRCWNKTGELLALRHDVGLIGTDRPRAVVAVLVDELADERSRTSYRGGPACDRIAMVGRHVFDALA
ncbi:serine hydrolase [Saccharopolyspora phatthalungensis]|uniref:Beta-lactamase class A n=1 Tax=Saccharopolyspora phatthalungensis TaxID=664693 RepID=A0A840QD06_9PSEU|nr:serine hydrolase [Saccharopolyspora phatthalungensis]MBB5157867.1 beta-lactamase class A [Saccharopolyspora phatthalungensis]